MNKLWPAEGHPKHCALCRERWMAKHVGKCQVCDAEPAVGVASSGCGPISFAYGKKCLELGAEPFWALVAYFASGGIVDRAGCVPDYWPTIEATCKVAEKPESEFWRQVSVAVSEFEKEDAGR